jgi:nicotinamide-nucleotide amidase
MESVVLELLRERGLTLGIAESLTGGLMGSRIAALPGCGDVYRGGVIASEPAAAFKLLGVPEGPVVSAQAAEAMARGVREALGVDVGLASTGVAGPDEQEGQPVGTVFIGLALPDQVKSERVHLPGDRNRVRQYATISALNMLRRHLLGLPSAWL